VKQVSAGTTVSRRSDRDANRNVLFSRTDWDVSGRSHARVHWPM